jgi:DNA primase
MEKEALKNLKASLGPKDVYGKYTTLTQQGSTWVGRCPLHAEKTGSFKVDKKEGEWVFHCFGCKKGGDVVLFLEYAENLTTAQAIIKFAEMTGTLPNNEYRKTAKQVDAAFKPVTPEEEKKTIPLEKYVKSVEALLNCPEALRFLNEQRGISRETAERLSLGFVQQHPYAVKNEENRAKGWICFPRVYGDQVRAIKFRSIAAKDFSQVKGMDGRAFFNFESINPFEPVFVTEGEFDACIMEQAGFSAVSAPSAGVRLTPEMKDALKRAPALYLAGDNDGGVGNEYMRKLHKELGENTFILKWPDGVKDANNFFLKTCSRDIDKYQLAVERLMETARSTPIEGFTSVIKQLRSAPSSDAEKDPDRLHMPWRQVDEMSYNPKGSVVILYSTYTGTGKTIAATQINTHEAKRGEVVVVFSPEVRGQEYLALLASQNLGIPRNGHISQENLNETADLLARTYTKDVAASWYHMREENYDVPIQFYVGYALPVTGADEVIAFIEEVIKRTGATRFVIDTLHKVVEPKGRESQTEAEGRTVKAFEQLGIKYGTIFILIGQSNKEGDSIQMSNRDEQGVLRGSREVKDAAASIYLLHRKLLPRKDGEDPDDTMELEAGLFLKKERFKGKGKPQTVLVLDKKSSKFYPKAFEDGNAAA